jgi:hypothetical protein
MRFGNYPFIIMIVIFALIVFLNACQSVAEQDYFVPEVVTGPALPTISPLPTSHIPEILATNTILPSPTINNYSTDCPPIIPYQFHAIAIPTNTVLPISAVKNEDLIGLVYSQYPEPYGVHFEYGGSSILTPGLEFDDASPTDNYSIKPVRHLGERVIWFSRGVCRHYDGTLEWQLIDVLRLPPLPRTHALLFIFCGLHNVQDEAIFVIARAPKPIPPPLSNINPLGTYEKIEYAWRASIESGKIEEIEPANIVCYMSGEGVPPPGQ